ncbi:MAG: nuclear transport factor 2 family protein [Microbacteriaceae bacterium]|nr:nuclear transport factor 2 family protein [Microbacteriaceae bacterium]
MTAYDPQALPPVIVAYLLAHQQEHDVETAVAAFAPAAVVTDVDTTHVGTAGIRDWIEQAASEYAYTVAFTEQSQDAEGRWVVLNHLEGDFPGGVVDLRFRFTIVDGLIARLDIQP